MTPAVFSHLAAQVFNRIPVMREVLADLDTPLSSYLKLARGPYSYLFEAVQGGEYLGRYSIIGLPARTVLRAHGDQVQIERDGAAIVVSTCEDPLACAGGFEARYKAPERDGLPRCTGGLVDSFGCD